ncbi:MAG: cytochrome c3 family protein [Bacteroidetes bacterium]|nr:cytochrome c3 family protein [Bacteroidota bacterium]
MKIRSLSFLTVVFVLLAFTANAQLTGSAHDFHSLTWNTSGEICLPCHTPHNGSTTLSDAPLWNHAATSSTFTLYSSGTMNATMGQPTGVSKLCLSCHDGSVALDSYGGTSGTTYVTGGTNFGTDLTNDHPISISYTAALATADGELHDPTTTLSGLSTTGNIDDDMLFGTAHDKLECSSCHDVHNSGNHGGLLVKSNAASALCITCHNK